MADLTEHEIAVLEFAKTYWHHLGAREQAITDLFGMSVTRYQQELNGLLDRPEALVYAPVLINGLRRRRQQARAQRQLRRPA